MTGRNVVSRRVLAFASCLLAATAAWSVAGMGVVLAAQGAEALYATVEAWRREMVQESASDADRAKLFERLKQASEKLRPMREETQKTVTYLEQQIANMKAQYGDQPMEDWKEADRKTMQRNQEALAKAKEGWQHIDGAYDDLKWLIGRQGVPGFNPFKNKTFQDRFKSLGEKLQAAAQSFQEFNDTYSVDTGKDQGVGSAAFVQARAGSKDVQFIVNGTKVGGDDAPLEAKVRLDTGRAVTIRAQAIDEYRRKMLTTWKQIKAGGLRQVKVREEDVPYVLHYGTDNLASWARVEAEKYEWSWGSQMAAAFGKASPWSNDPTIIPSPTVSAGRAAGTKGEMTLLVPAGDQVTWVVPASDEQREFAMDVIATLRWTIGRQLGNGQPNVKEESTATNGQLSLTVMRR